ncbi:MAG: endolytic transglycosylase MltG [Hydrogenophilaceae bacterium]|nr:endolytic transglycosylase MltG [Hydrogenophilaceae bacterium]
MKIIKFLTGLGLLAAFAFSGWVAWFAYQPLSLPSAPLQFTVTPGTSLKGLAAQLKRAGMLKEGIRFRIIGRIMGYASLVQSGTYSVDKPLTPLELYGKLVRGEVTQAAILLVEGWNIREVRQELARHPQLEHRLVDMTDAEVLAEIGAEERHPEGLFFPDTYFFNPGSEDIEILRRAYRKQKQKLNEAWETRSPGLPYSTPYEALIMASIIEKETGAAEERPLIAAVFINRTNKGMRLQTDPTVIYGMGASFDGNLRKADLQRDTPYNTYTRKGLPPTPIAMPGEAAIRAALNPARSDALYFVARGNGTHYFSATLEEHNRAVNLYQR